MTKMDPISRAVACNLCTGCGACAGLAPDFIRMVEDPVQGRRPVVADSPKAAAAAHRVAEVCAGLGRDHRELPRVDALDKAWGPVRAAWVGYAGDTAIRFKGSSGGAVTALALYAVQSGRVGAVAHTVADPADARRTVAAISRTRDEVMRGAGSRYAQASPAEVLAGLAEGQTLFLGKPCDVASVAKAREMRKDVAAAVPLIVLTMGGLVGLPVRDWIGHQAGSYLEFVLATPIVI